MLAFQTARSSAETAEIWRQLGDSQKNENLSQGQKNLSRFQYVDFAFIAAYTFLFLVSASIGRRRQIRWSKIAGRIASVSVVVTALADISENIFTLKNAQALQSGLPEPVQTALMRGSSLTKWTALGVTLILFCGVFLPSRRGSALYRLLAMAVAAFSLISGLLGVSGLWDITKLELVIPFFAPALLLQVPLFWRYWDDVVATHAAALSPPIEAWENNVRQYVSP
jgi:hypothetical protein